MNLNLKSTVASNSFVEPEDAVNSKKALVQTGYMKPPAYGLDDMPDKPMIDGIKKLQQDHGLKVDGIMKPGGETEKKLQSLSSQSQQDKRKKTVRPPHHEAWGRKPQPSQEQEGKSMLSDPVGFVGDYVLVFAT